jgi:DnaJ-class molecular chaperone
MGQTEELNTPIKYVNQRCGLCNGFGTLKYGEIVCKACAGKGIVVVDQETGAVVQQPEGKI